MGLGLDIVPGRRRRVLEVEVVRPVSEGDLQDRAPAPPATEIQRITERHHALARALASGLSNDEAAAVLGYHPTRVSILKQSPAFQELLALYSEKRDLEFAEFSSRLAGLAKDSVLELQARLEEAPGDITTTQLLEILKTTADRTGYGPTSKQETTLRVDLADRLKAARERLSEMKDVTPEARDVDE